MKGLPATSTTALGMVSVIGRNRLARPPARMATGSFTRTALSFPRSQKRNAPLRAPRLPWHGAACCGRWHRTAENRRRRRRRVCRQRRRSSCLDHTTDRYGHCSCRPTGASCAPMLMHQRAKLRRLARFKKRFAFQSKLLDEMQIGDHVLVAALGLGVLILQNRAGAAREPGEEQQQIVFKIEFRIHRDLERRDIDRVIGIKREAGQSAARGDILILLADWFSETIDLDLASKLRQVLWLDLAHPMYVERLEQRCSEASGG